MIAYIPPPHPMTWLGCDRTRHLIASVLQSLCREAGEPMGGTEGSWGHLSICVHILVLVHVHVQR